MADPQYLDATILMMSQPRGAMKVTTIRFGGDVWRLLEGEAAFAGVSVSQYIREAALARAAASAALRDDDPLKLLAGAIERRESSTPRLQPSSEGPGRVIA
jgi:hypothetical protein